MKSIAIMVAALVPVALVAGCDGLFSIDNYSAPNATLSGSVVFEGQPVGVRQGGVQLELWQPGPEFELNQKIPVNVHQDGTFSAAIFDGSYEINLLSGNGPWVNNPQRIPVTVKGDTRVDLPVTPYYTIANPSVVNSSGNIQVTFNVRQVNTSREVEFVGLYVGVTAFVDRIVQVARVERARSTLGSLNNPISMSVPLPANIHLTAGPERRSEVFVRIGVKTVGVAEMLFIPVQRVAI